MNQNLFNFIKFAIIKCGLEDKTFYVGGCVRDEKLGQESKDYDLVVNEENGAECLAKVLAEHSSTEARQIGAGYPIWQVIAIIDGVKIEIEIADTQSECFMDPNSRQRVTKFGTLEEDAMRRDFTCNMLYRNAFSGIGYDMSERGLRDIRAGELHGHPKVSLDKMFSDDPLRMMRLIRFHCRFGWKIPLYVMKAVRKNAMRIMIVSEERIGTEILNICKMGKLGRALRLLKATNLLRYTFPEIQSMVGCTQDKTYHSEGDVFTHTVMVVDKAVELYGPDVTLQLAALCHDLGKPATRTVEQDGRIRFLGHEAKSAEICGLFLLMLRADVKTRSSVRNACANHLRPHFSAAWKKPAVRRFIRDMGEDLELVLRLADADAQSAHGPDGKVLYSKNQVPKLRERIAEASIIPIQPKRNSVVNGHDIMTQFKLKQGPLVKQMLEKALDLEDEIASEGRVPEKDEIIARLKLDAV